MQVAVNKPEDNLIEFETAKKSNILDCNDLAREKKHTPKSPLERGLSGFFPEEEMRDVFVANEIFD